MSRSWRAAATISLFAGFWLSPSLSRAAENDTPSVISYGFDGFWTGAQIGLASGYLATGREYESDEWRKLVFGAGVGALVGVGAGITLGILDLGSGPPPTGHIILRDVGYGVGLGAIVGTAVGALFLIDDGRPKNLLTGAAVGSVVGAGAGLVFGVIEGVASGKKEEAALDAPGIDSVRFTLIGAPSSLVPMPALEGRF
ncbi:MAG TPA: hypothetical protein VMG12_40565 [Polyangiaceae bacterium]|nr:hypothetical protein [Polyangiaceae bacterium]